MSNLVWENRVENPFFTALNSHRPVEDFTPIEYETCCATRPERRGYFCRYRTRLAPSRKRLSDPFDGEVVAVLFGSIPDLLCQLRIGGFNDKVGCSIPCSRKNIRRQDQNCYCNNKKGSSFKFSRLHVFATSGTMSSTLMTMTGRRTVAVKRRRGQSDFSPEPI